MKSITLFLILISSVACAWAQPPLDTLWTKNFGGAGVQKLVSVVETQDNNLIFVGNKQSADSNMDAWILAVDSLGETLWEVVISEQGDQFATDIEELPDGGFIVVGSSTNPFGTMALRLDSNRNLSWYRVYQTLYDPVKVSVASTSNSDFVIATHTSTPRACILWISANGDSLTSIVDVNQRSSEFSLAIKSSSSNIFLAGWASEAYYIDEPPQWVFQSWLIWSQLRGDGTFVRGGGSAYWGAGLDMRCKSIKSSPNGRLWLMYTIIGQWSYRGGVVPLDTLTYRPMISFGRPVIDFVPIVGNEFIALDDTLLGADRDFRILRFDSAGHELSRFTFGGTFNQTAVSLEQTENGEFMLLGTTTNQDSGDVDAVVMRIRNGIVMESNEHSNVIQSFLFSAYPNPFNPTTTLSLTIPKTAQAKISIMDILGREVMTLQKGILQAGEHEFRFDGTNLPSGIYFANLQSGEFNTTKKLLLLK